MSFLLTIGLAVAAGLALLDLLRLRTGRAAVDAALGWLAGSGWLAAALTPLRFLLHVPVGRVTVLAVLLAPVALCGALRWRRRSAARAGGPAADAGQTPAQLAAKVTATQATPAPAARWLPRPAWLFAPLAVYVVVVAAAIVLHGSNTPTHTDDGVRVRAFAPMLAFDDAWSPQARGVFGMASPLSTFVPAVAWILTGTLDHFHVNYAILTELLALLVLVVGLASTRGDPERGWAGAFAVLSIPLFVYHCTSTYSDAVLAMRIAGAVLLLAEAARTRDGGDLARAALLLGFAALVKREGELVAAAPGAVLVALVAWERWRGRRPIPWPALALLVAPGVLSGIGKIAALGLAGAFPMLGFVAQQTVEATTATAAVRPPGMVGDAAQIFFVDALFRSGNAGMLYWILVAVLVVRARALLRPDLGWPLLALAALFAEVAVSSIFLIPNFTLDQGTVNRALLVVSVPAALWVAAALADAARERAAQEAVPAVAGAGVEPGARPRERRRSRRASRR